MKFTVPASVTISGWIEVEAIGIGEAKAKAERLNDDGIDADDLNDRDYCSVVHADEAAPMGDNDSCPHCGSDDLEDTPDGTHCAECGVLVDEYDAAKTVCRIADCHICDARCNVPPDYEVQPLGPDDAAERRTTCGACGLSWDDARVTSMTPTPSGRCPFEAFHNPEAT